MDMLCETMALQLKLLLTARILCPPCRVGESLFLLCLLLKSHPRSERSEYTTKMNGDKS